MKNGKGRPGYAGKVKNTGSQFVEAPFDSGASGVGKGKVIRGNDLRNGKGKSGK